MRKSKKQMVMAAAACAMMGVMAIGGTMAYLTDSETATNTFTIGQVKIDLEEPEYAKLTETQKQHLVPNQIVAKDPQVENTGVNDAIVFLKVEMPKKAVIVAEKDGTRKTTAVTELFTMLNTDIDPATDGSTAGKNWVELQGDDTGADTNIHVYAYKEKLAKDAKTTALFDSIQLQNIIEGQIDTDTENIKVTAYAIQAAEVLEGEDTDLTDTLTKENLQKIYNVYGKQNNGQTVPEANTNNSKNLEGNDLSV